MPIKKRNLSAETPLQSTATGGLNIVAKPKKPIAEHGKLRDVYGDTATLTRPQAARIALTAQSCGVSPPDADLSVEDRVRCLRTPYDPNNPQEARYRNRVKNRATAITAMCIVCQGTRKGVTECIDTKCPLWAFRFGSDPFYGKRGKK